MTSTQRKLCNRFLACTNFAEAVRLSPYLDAEDVPYEIIGDGRGGCSTLVHWGGQVYGAVAVPAPQTRRLAPVREWGKDRYGQRVPNSLFAG